MNEQQTLQLVITFTEDMEYRSRELYLLSIYDKSEQADISDKLLKQLIENVIESK